MTTALALAGCDWANLRTVTPAQHAEELFGPSFKAAGWSRLVPGVDLLLIEEVLTDHGQLPGGYLSTGAGQSVRGLAPLLGRTLHTLQLSGVSAGQLRASDVEAGKTSSIALVYEAYQSALEESKSYDDAHLFSCALERLGSAYKPDPETVFAIADATPLAEMAHRYVQAVSGHTLVRIGHSAYGVALAQQSAATRLQAYPLAGSQRPPAAAKGPAPPPAVSGSSGSQHYVQGDLFAAKEPGADTVEDSPKGDLLQHRSSAPETLVGVHEACTLLAGGEADQSSTQTQLREAHGSESEVRGALREVLARQLPLDSVEIAYTKPTPYLSLLVDVVQRFEVAAHFAAGIPATLTRPGQAMVAFYGWILSDFAPAQLIHALRSGLICTDETDHTASLLPSLLARARVAGGRDSYRNAFDRLRAEAASGAAENVDHIDHTNATIDRLLDLVPTDRATGRSMGLGQVARMSIDFLNEFAPVRGDMDRRAHDSLLARFVEIGASVDVHRPLVDLIEWLQARVEEHNCEVSVARAGSLYIAPLSRAGYGARPHLFIVGMDESSFPGGAFEEALLHDEERQQVSQTMPLQRHRAAAHTWQLARAIGMCPGTVTLVANRTGLSDGREPYPSTLFQHLRRQLGEPPVKQWRQVPERDEAALDETEQALARYRDPGYEQEVEGQFPWLGTGARAMRARAHKGTTRFDGWLGPRRRPELAIHTGAENVMSAAKLETLAKCPRQYFLRYVLGARPPEEVEDDPARWLQPLEMGQLLHELYCEFMSQLLARGERVDDEDSDHEQLLFALLDQQIALFERRIPVLYRAAYRADVLRLRRCARIFLNAEGDHARQFPTTVPSAFEVEFKPVSVELSARVRFSLRGRIDRIDTVEGGAGKQEYEIWDYKTGSPYRFEGRDLLQGGQSLQWVLYAYALEERTGVKVRRSGYFFSGDRGWGRRFEAALPARALVAALLEPLFEMVAHGAFLAVQQEHDNHCRFCDFRRLCSSERKTKRDLSEMREETSQLRAIAAQHERLQQRTEGDGSSLSTDTVQAYLAEAGIESIDDVLVAEADASLLHWMSGLQPELEWR